MRIVIYGCGVVGNAYAKAYESVGHSVFRHDVKIGTTINNVFSFNPDLIYVCLPTPQNSDWSCDISIVDKEIGKIFKKREETNNDCCVVIKSTVSPGTCDKLVEKHDIPTDFFGHSAEYLKERQAEYDAMNQKVLVIGTYGNNICSKLIELSNEGLVNGKIYRLVPTESEISKYFHNNFNALRIIFAVQMYKLCEEYGVSYNHVKYTSVASNELKDEYLDANEDLLGFTGVCLPKDTKALSYEMSKLGIDSSLIDSIININDNLPKNIIGDMRCN